MGKPTSYLLASYGDMISNRPRMEPYARALHQALHPGCTVLDIGAGTGIFSLLACQFGAGHVHAVELDDAIQVAQYVGRAMSLLLPDILGIVGHDEDMPDLHGHGRQFGVMADEVEQVMPEAVSVHPDGYKMVDYAMLGISRNLH